MALSSKRSRWIRLDREKGDEASSYDGQEHTLQEWSDITGNSKQLIRDRIMRGWSERRAILTPSRPYAGKDKDVLQQGPRN
jgi:hypothetical protein